MRLGDLDALKETIHNSNLSGNREWLLMDLDKIIDNAPTVPQISGRTQGEWIPYNLWDYECSNCKKVYGREYNFCPNCGAQMLKGDTE